jgi:tripartite-type tricarboxylate transporter receptor subunit TctC
MLLSRLPRGYGARALSVDWRNAMPTKRAFLRTLVASLCVPPAVPAIAETYPSRALSLIVPFPAGGPTDVLARILAARMKDTLGQTVVVDNVSGAGGTIAVAKAVRSPPDGYTLSIGQLTSHVMSGAAYVTNYDLLKDLEPVAMLTTSPLWVIGRNTLPGNSLQDVVAWLKANPDKASVATIGTGSPAHVWAVFFQEQTGTRFQLVPYRGAAPAIQDMIAGRIDLASLEASSTLPYVKSGQIKAFAMLTKSRWAAAPDVPTTGERGLPGLEMPYWNGLWVPKGTPKEIVAKLNNAVVETLADPAVRQRLIEMGQEIPPRDQQTPEALAARHKADVEKWWPIMKAANIKSE